MKKYLLMFMFPALIAFTGCDNGDGKTPEDPNQEDPNQELPTDKYERFVSRIDVTENGGSFLTMSFSYDGQGRPVKIQIEDLAGDESDVAVITYPNNNTVEFGDENDGGYTLSLNSDGFATSIVNYDDDGRESIYTYSNGYVTRRQQEDNYTHTYVWSDGNFVSNTDNYTPPNVFNYGYTTYLNNEKVNLDLNYLFMEELDIFGMFGWMGKRSKNLIRTGVVSMFGRGRDSQPATQEYYFAWEITCDPLSYTFDADGYVSSITLSWKEEEVKIYTATGVKDVLSTGTVTEVYSIIYAK